MFERAKLGGDVAGVILNVVAKSVGCGRDGYPLAHNIGQRKAGGRRRERGKRNLNFGGFSVT